MRALRPRPPARLVAARSSPIQLAPWRLANDLPPPLALLAAGVRVHRVTHEPGTYVLTLPRAYHGGFSAGVHVGEAVNLATADWLPFGLDAADRHSALRSRAVVETTFPFHPFVA